MYFIFSKKMIKMRIFHIFYFCIPFSTVFDMMKLGVRWGRVLSVLGKRSCKVVPEELVNFMSWEV